MDKKKFTYWVKCPADSKVWGSGISQSIWISESGMRIRGHAEQSKFTMTIRALRTRFIEVEVEVVRQAKGRFDVVFLSKPASLVNELQWWGFLPLPEPKQVEVQSAKIIPLQRRR